MSQLLPLPMSVGTLRDQVIRPALSGKYLSDEATVLLIAIALQESGLRNRDQREHPDGTDRVDGPALGLWQFEPNGGVKGVLRHPASAQQVRQACMDHKVAPTIPAIWKALELDDLFACKIARLLLWTDACPLPPIGAVERAWQYYLRIWRPGKPHKKTWARNYAAAMEAVQ